MSAVSVLLDDWTSRRLRGKYRDGVSRQLHPPAVVPRDDIQSSISGKLIKIPFIFRASDHCPPPVERTMPTRNIMIHSFSNFTNDKQKGHNIRAARGITAERGTKKKTQKDEIAKKTTPYQRKRSNTRHNSKKRQTPNSLTMQSRPSQSHPSIHPSMQFMQSNLSMQFMQSIQSMKDPSRCLLQKTPDQCQCKCQCKSLSHDEPIQSIDQPTLQEVHPANT